MVTHYFSCYALTKVTSIAEKPDYGGGTLGGGAGPPVATPVRTNSGGRCHMSKSGEV